MADIPSDVTFGRITWSGTYGSTPEEIFSYGRWAYWTTDADLEDVLTTVQDDVTNLLAESTTGSTPFSALSQIFPSDVAWTKVKVHAANKATGVMLGESHERELTDVGLGAEGNGLPYQLALAITAEAAFPRRKNRTRFYLPRFVHNALNGHGRVLPTLVDDIQTQLEFQQTANGIASLPVQYCIFSKVLAVPQVIDRWRTGDVMDTIRRRRNKLPEVRHVLSA